MKNHLAAPIELTDGKHCTGTVWQFDEHVGLGEIIVHNEGLLTKQKIPFHCVNLADGSRTIEIDRRVSFKAFWHPRGRFEATNIEQFTIDVYFP